jgi:hypothetical protein
MLPASFGTKDMLAAFTRNNIPIGINSEGLITIPSTRIDKQLRFRLEFKEGYVLLIPSEDVSDDTTLHTQLGVLMNWVDLLTFEDVTFDTSSLFPRTARKLNKRQKRPLRRKQTQ